ncbi:MAG: glycosyltransferase family 9 protein [Candidatus Omnitrophota bacterium]
MNIRFMRFVDYWVGVPLCFILTVEDKLLKAIRPRIERPQPEKKILFIKLSELGSIILSYPLLTRIRNGYPQAKLFFLTAKRNKDVFKVLGGIIKEENVVTVEDASLREFVWGVLKAIKRLRKEKVDIIFDLELFSRFSATLSYLIKARKRIGFYRYTFEGLYRGSLFTHNLLYNPLLHISKAYLSLAEATHHEKKATPQIEERADSSKISLPKFTRDENIRNAVIEKLQRLGVEGEHNLILINPGEGALPLREWPIENFMALSKFILEDPMNYILLVGRKDTERKAGLLCASLNTKKCLNLIDKTTLTELLELFNLSAALITNDCGLAHLASLTTIKKFILFGPESPQVFSPLGENNRIIYSGLYCSPCLSAFNHRNSSCRDNLCLKTIQPEEVYQLIKESLGVSKESISVA